MKEPNMYRGTIFTNIYVYFITSAETLKHPFIIGVNCRIGMKGVTAAAHYDSRRNYVAMIRGRKRYVSNTLISGNELILEILCFL